jgi:hypothetical protein
MESVMKKSNLIIIIAFPVTIIWTLLLGWFGSSAINTIRAGKNSPYAVSELQKYAHQLPTGSTLVKELQISGDRTAIVTIIKGKEFLVNYNKSFRHYIRTNFNCGKFLIQIDSLPFRGDYIEIVVPDIPLISASNLFELNVKGLNQRIACFNCFKVATLRIDSCNFETLKVEFPGNFERYGIWISKTNRIDSLDVSINGYGCLGLGAIGKYKNSLRLSDSIEIRSKFDLFKLLYGESVSLSGNK